VANRETYNLPVIKKHLERAIHAGGESVNNDLPNQLRTAIEAKIWEHYSDHEGKPFTTLREWLEYAWPPGCGLGRGRHTLNWEELQQLCGRSPEHADVARFLDQNAPKGKAGRPKKGQEKIGAARPQFSRHGTKRTGVLRVRLAEGFPDYYDAYQRGEYKSVRAAAEAAGLVKPGHDALARLKNYWKRASAGQRKAFLTWVADNP
jgi:hypothetical protein